MNVRNNRVGAKTSNKTIDIIIVSICYLLAIIFLIGTIFFTFVDDAFDVSVAVITGIVDSILFLYAGYGTYSIVQSDKLNDMHSDAYLKQSIKRKKQLEKRKKRYNTIKKQKNMFYEMVWISFRTNGYLCIVGFVIYILIGVFVYYSNIEMTIKIFYILLIIMCIWYCKEWVVSDVQKPYEIIKKAIWQYGFDYNDVNDDFMLGITCGVNVGHFINIGRTYSIYFASETESFIIRNNHISNIEKRFIIQEVQHNSYVENVEQIQICLNTKTFERTFITDDISADIILAEYHKYGIPIHVVDMR